MADRFSLRTYALFILALLAAMLLCVCVGSVSVAPKDTLTAIFCALLGKPAPAGVAKNIIVNVRLPRVMNVALVGAALSLCGLLAWVFRARRREERAEQLAALS